MKDVSQGGQIASLQTALRDLQVAPDLRVDGVYGPKTEAAVRAFQKKNALAQDGKVGPATASVLASAVSKLKS
jgi:peptidoglycan hydrolase-like protein with peptidoglycan-binding domain